MGRLQLLLDPCRVCGGRGVVLVEIDGYTPFVECARCKATGREYNGYGKLTVNPCRVCKGVGAQPVAGSMKIIK